MIEYIAKVRRFFLIPRYEKPKRREIELKNQDADAVEIVWVKVLKQQKPAFKLFDTQRIGGTGQPHAGELNNRLLVLKQRIKRVVSGNIGQVRAVDGPYGRDVEVCALYIRVILGDLGQLSHDV